MGKNDFLTPKAIGNRIKAKGLTKLRFYCEMCQKACRDENGFKCHLTSDNHKRQMEIFGMAPQRVVDGYSEEFLSSFMDHMRVACVPGQAAPCVARQRPPRCARALVGRHGTARRPSAGRGLAWAVAAPARVHAVRAQARSRHARGVTPLLCAGTRARALPRRRCTTS